MSSNVIVVAEVAFGGSVKRPSLEAIAAGPRSSPRKSGGQVIALACRATAWTPTRSRASRPRPPPKSSPSTATGPRRTTRSDGVGTKAHRRTGPEANDGGAVLMAHTAMGKDRDAPHRGPRSRPGIITDVDRTSPARVAPLVRQEAGLRRQGRISRSPRTKAPFCRDDPAEQLRCRRAVTTAARSPTVDAPSVSAA